MKEIKLSQPIMAHGNELHVLELKEPTIKDIKKLGFPFDGQMIGDPKKVANYIVELGNVTPSSVDQLTPHDFLMITGEIMMFFSPKEKVESTAEEQQTTE
ncbi:phage tail assembly protein [Gilliamella intestini]|uniref:Phage tail assembly chaperone protein, E, or 41 or 14 n=1 Tax=Gilliamella intestini TaxID=1798183 RepID=A0A1C4BWI6_9GAMM|nr:phage tail assembly protein [Gilliamella intestini]SCC11124.1 Phage tail assembly chaperone protein, E, or 41 or 14 [Gilliamella intestini]